ncbi:MAG: Hsp20/alpha crystallin family protein [Candidatus Marinimicrobia bacterium]|nr:Hsp20/alpha crystallin family protein [Candidatus Neomarinimicrobiota bacterium]
MRQLTRRHQGNEIFPSTFNDFFSAFQDNLGQNYSPRMNLLETDDEYKLEVEAPGIKKDEIDILFEDNILTISGEKKTEKKEENSRYHINEISFGKFSRSFELPSNIDSDKIDAKWNDGLLNVSIPKSEKAKPKKIKIN